MNLEKEITPSVQCKLAGLKSLADLVKISEVSEQTLINWHKDKPKLFKLVLAGAVLEKTALVHNAELTGRGTES